MIERAYRGDSARGGWTHEADLLDDPRSDGATLAAVLDDPDEALLIAVLDGIVGCVQVSRRPAATAYLSLLAVDPRCQAGGLGKRLIVAAEAWAVTRFAAAVVELSVISQRVELIDYYRRRGYALTGEVRPFPVAVEPPLVLRVMARAVGQG